MLLCRVLATREGHSTIAYQHADLGHTYDGSTPTNETKKGPYVNQSGLGMQPEVRSALQRPSPPAVTVGMSYGSV